MICSQFGFNITNVICDGAPTNRAFIKAYFKHDFVDMGRITKYAKHPISQMMIFSIPDPSHVIKKIRKSLAGCFRGREVYTNVPVVGVDGIPTGATEPRRLSLKLMLSLNQLMQGKLATCSIQLEESLI